MEAEGPVRVSGRVTRRVLLLAGVSEAVNVPSMPVSCVHSSKSLFSSEVVRETLASPALAFPLLSGIASWVKSRRTEESRALLNHTWKQRNVYSNMGN